ncbi:DnaB-like helicase N-terminal domain-containing protein [Streptomyces chisholmiae]|uniref:DnaB-like helicase N-terminal domain-containing protein n=1 Tax=Streptomyces chisholmiae TaxID=3075540 RepID=UPI00374E11FF
MNFPNGDLELYAEQALFAALHTCPDHVPDIAKLLRPDDFADATHREHYRHLTNQPTSGRAPHQAQSLSAERCPNPDHAYPAWCSRPPSAATSPASPPRPVWKQPATSAPPTPWRPPAN